MKKLTPIFVFLILLSGCSFLQVDRKVILPTGEIYTVNARNDDFVSFEKDGLKITVDGRGRPGMIEQALGIMFMNLPDVEVVR